MRVLIVTGHFGGPNRDRWLLDDLADALVEHGHSVHVIVGDATKGRPSGSTQAHPRMRVTSVGVRRNRTSRLGKLLGYLQTGWGLHTAGFRAARGEQYDAAIYTSISCFAWNLPGRLRRRGMVKRLVLVLWDFFPIHQLEIGRIRARWLARPLKAIEQQSMRQADAVALMSEANVAFFRNYFSKIDAPVVIVPPWSSSGEDSLDETRWESGVLVAVFGGQIAVGRGLETLLEAGRLVDERVQIVIAGGGPDAARITELAREIPSVRIAGSMPRHEYRRLLSTAHVGIAVTVPGVTPPSFPSKIVEYCGLGVPVLVAVERSSDAGKFVESRGAGISVPAGDPVALAGALTRFADEKESGRLRERALAARSLFEAELSAARAASALVDAAVAVA